MAPAVATYGPRDPSRTVLYKVIAEHLERLCMPELWLSVVNLVAGT
jgi:hypothetical protein